MPETVEERLIRIETQLKQVLDHLQKGDAKFERIMERIDKIERDFAQQIGKVNTEMSFWRGGLAIVAVIWPVALTMIVRYIFG